MITGINRLIDSLGQNDARDYIEVDADAIMAIAYEKYHKLDTDELRERYWLGTPPAPDDAEAAEPDQDPA